MAKEVYREINRYNPYTGQTDTYMGTWEDYCKYMPDKDFKNPEPVYNPTMMQQARYAMSIPQAYASDGTDKVQSIYDEMPEYMKYAMFGPAGMIAYSGKKVMDYFDNPNMRY